MPVQVVLFEPEIPPNTGNIIRLCANTGAMLHLVAPLGFTLDDSRLKRAGLDYHEWASVRQHENLDLCLEQCRELGSKQLWAFSTKGKRPYSDAIFQPADTLVFGPETRGLPEQVLERFGPERVLRLPMRDGSRSLNLSNAVAVAVFEAWRQQGFSDAQ